MTNSHEAFPSSVDPPSPTVRTDDTGVLYDTDLDPSQVSAAHLQNIVARLPGQHSRARPLLRQRDP